VLFATTAPTLGHWMLYYTVRLESCRLSCSLESHFVTFWPNLLSQFHTAAPLIGSQSPPVIILCEFETVPHCVGSIVYRHVP